MEAPPPEPVPAEVPTADRYRHRPDRRRWPTVPWEVEREIAALDVVEWCLNNPEYKRRWWDPLRSGRSPAGDVPSGITINYEHIRQQRAAIPGES
jgi:hypothetical protein